MALIPADEGEFGVEIRNAPPAHLIIKVESFSKLSKHGVEKQESREFTTGNYKWRLTFYPQVSGGNDVYVCLTVANSESLPVGWRVDADCNILLHSQISNNYLCFRGKILNFNAKYLRWGFSISYGMLTDGYLVDDNCTFGAEVFLISKRDVANECLSLFDWMISDFSKLKGVWTSQEFTAGDFQWKMQLYPNGNTLVKGKSVSIYLVYVASKSFAPCKKVKVDLCVSIKNKLPHARCSKKTSHWFTFKGGCCGFCNFMPITDMLDPGKGFLINDCCFLETHISVQDAVYEPKPVGPN